MQYELACTMKDYLFKFSFIMIIIFLSYPSLSKDIVKEVAKSMGFEVNSGNDLVILPTYLSISPALKSLSVNMHLEEKNDYF